jgi:hypothetical protein
MLLLHIDLGDDERARAHVAKQTGHPLRFLDVRWLIRSFSFLALALCWGEMKE